MDRGAWQAIVHGIPRVRHDLATKTPPPPHEYLHDGILSARKGSAYKECTCNAGGTGNMGLIPGLGRSPGKGNGNHSSIIAWKNPCI